MKKGLLDIQNLWAETEKKEILKGVNLSIKSGEVHAVMGPNGAGKTTLAMSLMGNPGYNIKFQISSIRQVFDSEAQTRGAQDKNIKYQINGKDMTKLSPEERARAGLFVSFQSPIEISGVSLLAFLRTAYKSLHPDEKISLTMFKDKVKNALIQVGLSEEFISRSVNEGFSGGEKKRTEIAQLLVLEPKFAILDEIDSGLDIDSLRQIAKTISSAVKKNHIGILLITHYQRILHYLHPDYVHVLKDGKIVKSDGMALVREIERNGYAAI